MSDLALALLGTLILIGLSRFLLGLLSGFVVLALFVMGLVGIVRMVSAPEPHRVEVVRPTAAHVVYDGDYR